MLVNTEYFHNEIPCLQFVNTTRMAVRYLNSDYIADVSNIALKVQHLQKLR